MTTHPADALMARHPGWQVPEFDLDELSPRSTRYCVCVFVLNEGERIRKQLAAMRQYAEVADIVIADGGSTDGALDLDYLRSTGVRALITKRGPGKLSAQMRMALAWAVDQGYDGVVVVDGNGKDDVAAIPAFVAMLAQGFDHVQGSRFVPGGRAINTPVERLVGLKLIHAPAMTLATGKRHSDTTNGFRAYSARLLSDPSIAPFREVFQAYELHYYLDIEANVRREYRTCEIPVTRRYPRQGKTPTKISPVKGNLAILATLYKAVTRQYRPRS